VSVASCLYGGLSEFIQNDRTGFLLNQHDTDKLAEVLCRLVGEPALALDVRGRAVALLKQSFSNQAAADFYERYFRTGKVGNEEIQSLH
jgi:hypothetical protein